MWRKAGTIMARWPAPMIAVAALIIPLCISGLAAYKVSYNDRNFAPASIESSTGYAAADKHFPRSWLSNDIVYVQSDHDLRNTTDMISMDRIAKSIIRVPGIALVQSVTRPSGRPMEHASLPFSMGSMGTKIGENIGFLRDRAADIDKLAAHMGNLVDETTRLEQIDRAIGRHHPPTVGRHPHITRSDRADDARSATTPEIIWRITTMSSGLCAATSTGIGTALTSQYARLFGH